MKINLVGCGKIGKTIVERLVSEGHDIVAIDANPTVLNEVTNIYDVMGLCGNGADSDVLIEANTDKADLFLAVTGSDELNMLSCFLARRLGAKNTIARIRNPEYNDQSLNFLRQQLELSMSVNPDMLAAQELFNILKFPSAVKIETFSRRHMEMIELRLTTDSVLHGLKLSELREKYRAKVLICCVKRGDEVFIPDGNFALHSEDRIGITAAPSEIQKFLRALGLLKKQAKNVMLLGGSRTARYLAQMLLGIGCNVKIIERDEKKAIELCEALPEAVIIQGDGAQQELLLEEGLRSLDAFVALTGMDELNILTSIFASAQNVPKVIAKVNRDELTAMARKMGLDTLVSPKLIVADVLVSHARALQNSLGSSVETLYKLMEGDAEALEFIAKNDSRLVNIPLKDLSLKSGTLIAGIIRDRKTIIPGGNDAIQQGDHVIVVAAEQHFSDLADILR